MMGKSHAMSASAVALTAAAVGVGPIDASTTPISVLCLYTAVAVGGSLWPDWDSHGSTVVRSFGIFGKVAHEFVNGIGTAVYNLTRVSKYEKAKDGGHRTLFHTPLMAIITGLIISGLSVLPGSVDVFGHTYAVGQLASLIIMWLFLHVGLAGLFEKQVKKARKTYGPYLLMAASLAGVLAVSRFMPENETYGWLGVAATGGIIIHLLGDMITKMGIPMLWPLKIRGKRWYDVSLPTFMRISAGGTFETVVLFPIFSFVTVVSAFFCIPYLSELIRPFMINIAPWMY